MGHVNIEIKARCENPNRIREILKSKSAKFIGEDHQIDMYFDTKNGRLKLREGNIENNLIYYERNDESGPKQSNVILLKAEPNSPLKEILLKSIGTKVIVDKRREIYFIDNVKFHIDLVEGLGSFVEIEAIDERGDIGAEELRKQCDHFIELLGIKGEDLLSNSYSDLLKE